MMYQIEITTHCNFECFYCAGREMPQRHMAWELFTAIIDGIPPGRHMVSLQGEGEPTTHPRFWDMAERTRARGLTPFTITNGAQIDVERIASTFPRIGVSIDTLDAAEAERIGRYKFERVLANVEALSSRMSGKRIHIMTVNYGQPLEAVREFARARGFSHSVQPLQTKPDYSHRYPGLLDTRAPRYTHHCRYLERPLRRYYDIEGREYPCCYIKDARLHEPIDAMRAKMAGGEIPAACAGCREVLTADSVPRPRAVGAATVAAATVSEAKVVEGATVAAIEPVFSLITTCKGRLAHLKEALPRMALQADAEVIVVDYDCPEHSGRWVAENFPDVRVVGVESAPRFNISHARNLGSATAHGRWLCFVDADVLLDPDFVSKVRPLLQDSAFFTVDSPQAGMCGSMVCMRDDFAAIGGYDEVIQGYGTEDRDIYLRLAARGCKHAQIPGAFLQLLANDREASVRHYDIKDHRLSQRINATYVQIKQDLTRQFGAAFLTTEMRTAIYGEIRRAFQQAALNGQPSSRVDITLPADLDVRFYGWQMTRVWTYLLHSVPPAASPAGVVAGGLPVAGHDPV